VKLPALLAGLAVVVAAVVVVIVATGSSDTPTPPATAPPPSGDVTGSPPTPDAAEESSTGADPDKHVVDEVVAEWEETDEGSHDADETLPLTDEQWADNPCNTMAQMITGAMAADDAQIAAQIEAARNHHRRNHIIDLVTWNYAGCRAIRAGDPSLCRETPGVVMPMRCDDNLITFELAKGTDPDACLARISSLTEVKRDRFTYKQNCRAASGDASACENFRQPAFQWFCRQLANPDPSTCGEIEDPESAQECPMFAAFLRVARGLPAVDVELPPYSQLGMLAGLATDPEFDCAAWYRDALRAECR